MHHVELLLDERGDAAVRDAWRRLDDAGLPSQARHRSASNRPHVTLTMSPGWPGAEGLAALAAALRTLPLPVLLGPPLVFGRRRFVLARSVVVTDELLALHRAVTALVRPPAADHLEPGRWTPHVTLGRRLDAAQVGAALAVLAGDDEGEPARTAGTTDPAEVALVAARHWDSEARLDEPLTPR
ncbi:2'-5' RNA ligase family protein [Phycicoccus duodecadis]|uniref:2'-5' RNA ligase superfamily protein n=1 Tax=Phycicoccus duodecadis TaxID=173053 RepID=A0A2N3YKE6_9MICO|nr:2'-5' RNA ligase family protein [Phycicoccus duodecadis]PKW27331.1 2'-5' RNA ligase superfamily protein [Phycicoccus duodecadis]